MLVKRIVAFIIDSIIIGILGAIAGAVIGQEAGIIVTYILMVAYQTAIMTAMDGKTIGKMVMGLRVVQKDGGAITPVQAFLRGIGYVINSIICGIGWILALLGIFSIHDTIAGTKVVEG